MIETMLKAYRLYDVTYRYVKGSRIWACHQGYVWEKMGISMFYLGLVDL